MPAPLPALSLSDHDREQIGRWLKAQGTPQQVALRSRIVLAAAAAQSDSAIANDLAINRKTVMVWRARFAEQGLTSLWEIAPGRGRKATYDGAKIKAIVDTTLQTKPKGMTHWSCRLMAARQGVSKSTVSNIWRSHHLKPHRVKRFKLSRDPHFLEKLTDVVGLYLNPPQQALVLCVDEKTQVHALDRTAPYLPLGPGQPARRTHDDVRHGTTSLFAALNVATGQVIAACHARHRAREFRHFLNTIDASVPADLEIHLVLDNYATQKAPTIRRWLRQHPRYHLHFIPTSSSWLNHVETWCSVLTQRQLRRGVHRSVKELTTALLSYTADHNQHAAPFRWTKSADEILQSIKRFCLHTSNSGH